jgi:peroxiredoxin
LQNDWEVSEAYEVSGTPSAVLVQTDGTIGSPVVAGSHAIQSLVGQTAGGAPAQLPVQPPQAAPGEPCPNCGKVHDAPQPAAPEARKIGEPAPKIKLKDLNDRMVELKDFRGKKTLVLFWNPGCSYCREILDELKEVEANPPQGAPKLLVVSSGTVETNKAMGLSSPVVLDQGFATGSAYGTSGTPTAVLVDEKGKIASEVAAGAPAVLSLARAHQAQA